VVCARTGAAEGAEEVTTTRTLFFALFISATACTQVVPGDYGPYYPQTKFIRLSNGDTLVVYRVKYWQFRDGSPPALQLEYESPVSVDDSAAVFDEAIRIWPAFAQYPEEAELNRAIITATNLTKRGFPGLWQASFKHFGLTVVQDTAGNWRFEGHQGVLPPAENPRSPKIFEANGAAISMKVVPEGQ